MTALTQVTHATIPLYGAHVHLAVDVAGWNMLRRRARLEEYAPDRPPAGCTTFSLWVPNGVGLAEPHLWILVNVESHPDPLELAATCAHEATHAALSLLEHIGHRPAGDDEPTAYLIGWLTMTLMAACGPKWEQLGRGKAVS